MTVNLQNLVIAACAVPFIYYAIVLYSSWRFFRQSRTQATPPDFTPPISNLKPIRGLDPDSYENFASLCRQDYPDYELLFCVGDEADPVVPILYQLAKDFPDRRIRVLFGSGEKGTNDKVVKLARLVREAQNEVLVINDSDVRVQPDYLRNVVAPLANPNVGATTCFYVPVEDKGFVEGLQTIGMFSDFYPGILSAWQLDGVKFTLGPSIATTKTRLANFGGYEALQYRPADDLLVGRLIAEQGCEVKLLPYKIQTVADYKSFGELLHKRMRWTVVMRNLRPWGHAGLFFTQGLPWALLAVAIRPTLPVAAGFLGSYLLVRFLMTWLIGIRGLGFKPLWKQLFLIPVWDITAFLIWLMSFTRNTIRWRDGDYYIRDGKLVPVETTAAPKVETTVS